MPRNVLQVIARELLIKEVLEIRSAIRSMWRFKHENPLVSQRTTKKCPFPKARQEIAGLVGTTIKLVPGWEAEL